MAANTKSLTDVRKLRSSVVSGAPLNRTDWKRFLRVQFVPIASPINVAIEEHADISRDPHRFGRLELCR